MEQKLKKLSDRITKAEKFLNDNNYSVEHREKYIPLHHKILKELYQIITKGYNIKL